MEKKYWIRFAKIVVFILCFAVIFEEVQEIFVNVCIDGERSHIEMLDSLPDDMDVLLLGSSQMACNVNADKLTEEFGINACDWGGYDQILPITYYYFQEAKKRIEPKLVAVEVTKFFQEGIPEGKIATVCIMNYSDMPLSVEKCQSVKRLFPGDMKKLLTYGFSPLLETHSYWNQINPVVEIAEMIQKNKHLGGGFSRRGFYGIDRVTPETIAYLKDDDGAVCQGAEDAISALYDIVEDCRQNGIEVLFFKTPSPEWTRSQSKAVKAFMEENHFSYLEMNDYLQEIGIDADTDFCDEQHLNIAGANKSTDFLARYLRENYGDILEASASAGAL